MLKFSYYDTLMYYFEKKSDDLCKLKRYEKEIQSFDKFIELEPDESCIYHHKGNYQFHLNSYEEAIQCYDKSLEIYSYFHEVFNSKGT